MFENEWARASTPQRHAGSIAFTMVPEYSSRARALQMQEIAPLRASRHCRVRGSRVGRSRPPRSVAARGGLREVFEGIDNDLRCSAGPNASIGGGAIPSNIDPGSLGAVFSSSQPGGHQIGSDSAHGPERVRHRSPCMVRTGRGPTRCANAERTGRTIVVRPGVA